MTLGKIDEEMIDVKFTKKVKDLEGAADSLTQQLADTATNVKTFGAIGDGITNDTQSFKDAVNSLNSKGGGTLFVPAGTYFVNDVIILPSNIHVKGAGMGLTTILTQDNGVDYQYIFYGQAYPDNRKSNIAVSDLTLDVIGDVPTRDTLRFFNVMRFNSCDGVRLFNIEVKKGHDSLVFSDCDGIEINNIHSFNNNGAAITLFGGTRNGIIKGLYVKDVEECIDFFNNENIVVDTVMGNSSPNSDNEAFDLSSSRNITLQNIYLDGFYDGIFAKIESNIAYANYNIDNVHFKNFKRYGIGITITSTDGKKVFDGFKVNNVSLKSSVLGAQGVVTNNQHVHKDFILSKVIIDTDGDAFAVGGGFEELQVDGCNFKSKNGKAFRLYGQTAVPIYGAKILNNVFSQSEGLGFNGIEVENGYNIEVLNNSVKRAGFNGMWFKNVSNLSCDGNTILDCGLSGIEIQLNNSSYMDTVNKLIQIKVSNNKVLKFGQSSSSTAALWLKFTPSDIGSDNYGGLEFFNNHFTADATFNSDALIISFPNVLDYIRYYNNTFYKVSREYSTATRDKIGINSLNKDNMIVLK